MFVVCVPVCIDDPRVLSIYYISDSLCPAAYRPPCPCLPRRWILSVTAMGGFAFVYAMRINMSIAIVCMVIPPNDTAVGATGTPGTGSCGPAGTDQQPDYPVSR